MHTSRIRTTLLTAFVAFAPLTACAEFPITEPFQGSRPSAVPFHNDDVEPLVRTVAAEASAVEELEARIAALESERRHRQGPCADEILGSVECALDRQDCGSGGLFGSVEVGYLRPRLSGATPAFAAANGGGLIHNSFETSIRYGVGYRSDSGLGVRGQYSQFDHAFPFRDPFAPASLSIQTQAADLEMTLDQRLRHFDMQLSSGVRYGQLRYFSDGAGAFGVGEASFEGIGPTVSLAAKRRLGTSGFALFGSLRGSLLWGEMRNASMLLNMPRGPIRDETARIFENQLGVSWSTAVNRSGVLEIRTAWETQLWQNSTFSDDVYGVGSDLSLMGPSFAVEFRY